MSCPGQFCGGPVLVMHVVTGVSYNWRVELLDVLNGTHHQYQSEDPGPCQEETE